MISKIREIYRFRELLLVFTKKELKVKYKNSALGFLWSFINPLILAVVYTLIFSIVFPNPIKRFPIYLLIGLIPWNFFTISIATCSSSIISNANLIKKVYFPRELIPMSVIFANLFNFILEMAVVMVILLMFGFNFVIYIPVIVLVVFLQTIVTIGFGFMFASLTVYFRDIEQIINIILLIWFFGTPIVYDMSIVASKSSLAATILKVANPMTSIILLYRQSLFNLSWPSFNLILYALGGCFSILFLGYFLFQKHSPNFAKEV